MKVNYHIEIADNGYFVKDDIGGTQVFTDNHAVATFGKMLFGEIDEYINKELCSAVSMEITLEAIPNKI